VLWPVRGVGTWWKAIEDHLYEHARAVKVITLLHVVHVLVLLHVVVRNYMYYFHGWLLLLSKYYHGDA